MSTRNIASLHRAISIARELQLVYPDDGVRLLASWFQAKTLTEYQVDPQCWLMLRNQLEAAVDRKHLEQSRRSLWG